MKINSFNFVKALKSHYYRKKSLWFFNHFTFYAINYRNWHHDIHPIVFIMWCNFKYTHGLNINYLNNYELYIFFNNILADFKRFYDKGGSWYIYYHIYLKRIKIYYKIIRKIYRTYFSKQMFGYVVGNGIFPVKEYKKIYTSMNFAFNKNQEIFNKKFNLGLIEEKKITIVPKQKEMNKIISVLRNVKKWTEGISPERFE